MAFPFNYFLAAFAGAFLTTLLALPLWRKWCLRIKLVDDPGQRKIHDQPIPLAGGLAIMTGLLIPALLACLVLWWQKAGGNVGEAPVVPVSPQEVGHSRLLDSNSAFLLQYG